MGSGGAAPADVLFSSLCPSLGLALRSAQPLLADKGGLVCGTRLPHEPRADMDGA